MKRHINLHNLFFLFAALLFASCEDQYSETFMANSPVYMTYDELRVAVKKSSARELEKPGKIYFKDNFLFINEDRKGVHIIDNSNPSTPQNIGFIEIPGNVDIAIKENVLYADSYIDLVAIDVSNLNQIKEIGRIKKIFPYTLPAYDEKYRVQQIDEEKGVVVDWEIRKVTEKLEKQVYPIYYRRYAEMDMMSFNKTSTGAGVGGSSGSTFGIGGSMARFGLYNDYLYIVDQSSLYKFKIKDINSPMDMGRDYLSWNIETMFIYDNHMFLGTTTGMIIYSLETPSAPKYVNQYRHITSCDPVVVANGLAYVTLRSGNMCGGGVDRLDVIKMEDAYKRLTLLSSFPMDSPSGLGVDGDVLFLCDGKSGMKVFDNTDPELVGKRLIASYPSIHAYDVIPVKGYLFMIGDDGFYLYDYSNLMNIKQIGTIPVRKKE